MSTVLPFKKADEASVSSDEEKGVRAGPDRVLVPDAEYDAQAVGHKTVPFMDTRKVYLKLEITTYGEHFGKEVWIVFQWYPHRYGARSKFYKAWVIAHGRKPGGQRIKPADLCGKIYRIRTRTVTTDEDGDTYPPELQYSVADKILALVQDNQSPTTNYRLPTSPSISAKRKKKGEVGK